MKARSALLVLVSLALAAAPLAAATAPSNDLAAALAQPAVSSLAGGACASTTPAATAGLLPAPTRLQTGQVCGTCSLNPCKNAAVNDFCVMPGFGNGTGVCLPPLGDNCSDGITWKCQCWNGPLP